MPKCYARGTRVPTDANEGESWTSTTGRRALTPKSAIRRLRGEAGGTLTCNGKESKLQAALNMVVLDWIEEEKARRMS